jgi:hypothetical protein
VIAAACMPVRAQVHLQPQEVRALRGRDPLLGHGRAHMLRVRDLPGVASLLVIHPADSSVHTLKTLNANKLTGSSAQRANEGWVKPLRSGPGAAGPRRADRAAQQGARRRHRHQGACTRPTQTPCTSCSGSKLFSHSTGCSLDRRDDTGEAADAACT